MDMDEGFNTSEAECDSEDEGEGEVELCMFLDQAATIQKALQKVSCICNCSYRHKLDYNP